MNFAVCLFRHQTINLFICKNELVVDREGFDRLFGVQYNLKRNYENCCAQVFKNLHQVKHYTNEKLKLWNVCISGRQANRKCASSPVRIT